jgi:hypothetical protein
MSEKTWTEGLANGAFKNRGSMKRAKRRGKKLRVGVRRLRMARRRGAR